ncbi:MAG: response regulator [Endomicrobiales bacterium]|nr:response regulator [Endomicrobiales bacterium]
MKKPKKILIIDDEKGYRDFYKFILEPIGFFVETAEDGETGLKIAKENNFDIIFLDVHMPKMKGPEVLREIKKAKPEQVVVVFSSSSDPSFSFENKAKDMGAFDCLFKPVELDDILKIVDRVVELSKQDESEPG